MCLIFHKWGKFGELQDCYEGYMKIQSRKCESCGKIQVKSMKIKGQLRAESLNNSMKEK